MYKYISSVLAICMAILSLGPNPNFTEDKNKFRIGIVDSGISSSSGIKCLLGYNYILNTDDTEDDTGHGTALASIILSISPDAEIVPLKVTGSSFLTMPEVTARAIYEAVDSFNCDMVLMSFGQPDSEVLQKAIEHAAEKGAILVSAVGNEGNISYRKNKIYYPAGYDEVIGVGSANDYGDVSEFSQKNSSVFIITKGENLIALSRDGTERLVSGTSFSAAAIAGLGANIHAENDSKLRQYLKSIAVDKGIAGFDNSYGWGVIENKYFEGVIK